MTPAQIRLVRQTWEQVQAASDQAAALFYRRLFELDPALRQLFKSDLESQGRKLMQLLGTAVRALEHPELMTPALKDLGQRHVRFGVRPDDYATAAVALLWMFEQQLGGEYTTEVRQAWTEVYMMLATNMQAH